MNLTRSPQDTVETLAEATGVPVPGDEETRGNRVAGLGPLTGLLAGVGIRPHPSVRWSGGPGGGQAPG